MSDKKEIEQLKQEIEKLKRQRDEAYANRDLNQRLLQEKIAVTNEMYEALEVLLNEMPEVHSRDCVIKARAALAKARGDTKKRTPESAKAYLIKSNKNELMHRTVFEVEGLYYSFFGYGRSAQEIWDAVKDSISNDTPLGLIKSEIDELNQNYLGEVK